MSEATVPSVTVATRIRARHRSAPAPTYAGRRRSDPGRNGTALVVRWTTVVVLIAAAAVAVVANHAVRGYEARVFAPLAGLFVGGGATTTSGSILYVGVGDRSTFGLQITGECTTAVLLVPSLLVIAGFAAATLLPVRRVLSAVAVAVITLSVVNAVRIAVVAFCTWHWGESGFRFSHVLLGSALALVGFALSIVLTVRTLTWRRGGDGGHRPARHVA